MVCGLQVRLRGDQYGGVFALKVARKARILPARDNEDTGPRGHGGGDGRDILMGSLTEGRILHRVRLSWQKHGRVKKKRVLKIAFICFYLRVISSVFANLPGVRHPFVVQLHYAFQSASTWYLVMDFAPNGQLFSFVRSWSPCLVPWPRLILARV